MAADVDFEAEAEAEVEGASVLILALVLVPFPASVLVSVFVPAFARASACGGVFTLLWIALSHFDFGLIGRLLVGLFDA